MTILILGGGDSSEREVSLRSAASVAKALRESNIHNVIEYDPASGLESLQEAVGRSDIVFPVLHGAGGEDGSIQSLLEAMNAIFVGSDSATSRKCFDKSMFKEEVLKIGIRTPKGEVVTKSQFFGSQLRHEPYVLKPNAGGSSVDTLLCVNPGKNDLGVAEEVFSRHPSMLLEELIVGTEITVSVLGSKALSVVEIIPPEGENFNYDNKYNGKTQELCPPLHVPEESQKTAQKIAETIHARLGVRHLSRTDMIVAENGDVIVLELNTMPGMTEQSLFPKAAKASGLSMAQLVHELIDMANSED